MFTIAMKCTLQKNLALASALAIGLMAQAAQAREYGYKDRIFEQKYLLSEQPEGELMLAKAIALPIRLQPLGDGRPQLPAPRIMQTLGGVCAHFLINAFIHADIKPIPELDQAVARRKQENQTQDKQDAESEQKRNTDGFAQDSQNCVLQLLLFEQAYGDSLSTRAQLEWLAGEMRQRYRNVWVSVDDATDPTVQEGARRLLTQAKRISRLSELGIDTQAELSKTPYDAQIRQHLKNFESVAVAKILAQPEPYASYDHQLTALEEKARQQIRQGVPEATQRRSSSQRDQATSLPQTNESTVSSQEAGCRIDQPCPVIQLTLFCHTPEQMQAILSRRPGPERKKVLDRFTASGACRRIRSGDTLHWTSPIITIQPKGEPAAELVPGTLADGMPGFALKDGIFPRVGSSAR